MKLLVDRLSDTPAEFRFEGDSAWWRADLPAHRGLPSELETPFEIRIDAHSMGENVYIAGWVLGELPLECSRCLARYRHAFREPFRLVLEPVGDRKPTDPESVRALARDGLCLGEDSDTGWFRGHEIDLSAAAREVISLALPVKPLCRDDCAGLCPHCGARLGSETGSADPESCGCTDTRSNSPFAVLASLKTSARRDGEQTEGDN